MKKQQTKNYNRFDGRTRTQTQIGSCARYVLAESERMQWKGCVDKVEEITLLANN